MSERGQEIDDAAFGVIYGTITVMGVLAATDSADFDPLATGLTLLCTVLAVALAKAYADVAARALKTGEKATWETITSAWAHSRTTLLAANGPTFAMFIGAVGVVSSMTAMVLAQVCALFLLIFYGWRIGYRLAGRVPLAALSALGAGGVGLLLTALKNALH